MLHDAAAFSWLCSCALGAPNEAPFRRRVAARGVVEVVEKKLSLSWTELLGRLLRQNNASAPHATPGTGHLVAPKMVNPGRPRPATTRLKLSGRSYIRIIPKAQLDSTYSSSSSLFVRSLIPPMTIISMATRTQMARLHPPIHGSIHWSSTQSQRSEKVSRLLGIPRCSRPCGLAAHALGEIAQI